MRSVEYAVVPVLPNHLGRQQGDGGKPFPHRFWQARVHVTPPVSEVGLVTRRLARQLQPGQDLMSYMPREGASDGEVVHRLQQLIA